MKLVFLILGLAVVSPRAAADDALEELLKKYSAAPKVEDKKPADKKSDAKKPAEKNVVAKTSEAKKEDEKKPTEMKPTEMKPTEKKLERPVIKVDLEIGSEKSKTPEKSERQTSRKPSSVESDRVEVTHAHTIQLASYSNEKEAEALFDDLEEKGLEPYITTALIGGKTWFRVNVGVFDSRREAQAYLDKAAFKQKGMVTRIPSGGRIPAAQTFAQPSSPKRTSKTPEKKAEKKEEVKEEKKSDSKEEAKAADAPELDSAKGLFGDWGGAKTALKEIGIETQARYKGDVLRNVAGGKEQKTFYLGNLDLIGEFDLEKLAGLKGLSLNLYGLGNHGAAPSEYIADQYFTDSIAAPSTFKLYEAYLKANIDDRSTLVLGLRDLNADFYSVDSAIPLLNGVFGVGPVLAQTGANGPSIFPATSLATTFRYESPTSFYIEPGIFNAMAGDVQNPYGTHITTATDNGYLYIWEMGFSKSDESSHYKYSLGHWQYSKPKEAIDETKGTAENSGTYFLIDQSLGPSVSVFLKYGVASSTLNQFASGTEAGVSLSGAIWSRPNDKLIFGYAHAVASDDYVSVNSSQASQSLEEIAYQIQVMPGLKVTPDFQYIESPGLNPSVSDSQVESVRIELEF